MMRETTVFGPIFSRRHSLRQSNHNRGARAVDPPVRPGQKHNIRRVFTQKMAQLLFLRKCAHLEGL